MSLETIVADLATATEALHTAISDKKTVLDNAAQQAATSLTTTQAKQAEAEASAATAAAKATEAANNASQIAAYKNAAAALNTATTATQAVTNLLPDMLAKKDPARHPFRNKLPSLVLDFERQRCHRYSPETGYGETPLNTFMSFARASTATYTGPDGLIKTAAINTPRYDYDPITGECKGLLVEEQRTNLLTLSDTFLAAGTWALGGGCLMYPSDKTSPTGQLRGVKLQSTGLEFTRLERGGVPATAGTSYSLTFILGRGTATHAHFTVEKYGISLMRAYVDLTALTCVVTKGSFTAASATAKSIGGFIVVNIVFTPSTNDALVIFVGPSNGGTQSTAGTTLYVYAAQLEAGSFPTSYIPTHATFTGRASTATYLDANGVVQTAASGVARSNAYDYDSDGVLRPVGLLLEGSATNLITYSQDITQPGWADFNVGSGSPTVRTANHATAPDGTVTADRLQLALNGGATVSDVSALCQQFTTITGSTYTQSVWLKTTDGSTKALQLSFNGDGAKIITVTGTWQRFSNTVTAIDNVRYFRLALRGTTGTSDSADILVWGAQQGVGYYPTSYIPTTSAQVTRAADTSTSAQVTRSADNASVTGSNFAGFYNQTQGTLVARGYTADSTPSGNSGTSRTLSQLSGGTDGVRVGMNNLCGYSVVSTGVEVAGTSSLGTWSSAQHALGVRIKKDDFAATRDGGTVSTATSAATPRALKLQLGSNAAVDGWLNGHVSRISYYPQPFTNEELQTFTAP